MVQHQGRGHRGVHRRQVNMNPDILSQIQASNSAANDPKATSKATESKPASATSKPPAAATTSRAVVDTTKGAVGPPAPATTKPTTAATSQTSARPATTSATSPRAATTSRAPAADTKAETTAEEVLPSSPSSKSSVVSSASSSPTSGVRSITASRSSGSSALPSASAASAESGSNGISGGGVAGIVLGLIAAIIIIGGLAGWFYRKYKDRSYGVQNSWTKMDNDDVTPYRENKAAASDEEFYPQQTNGSNNRALELARNNAFYPDGSLRPDSMAPPPGQNFAGYGSGVRSSPYPEPAPIAASYDQNGRPYTPDHHQNGSFDHHSGYGHNGYDQQYPHQHQQQQNPFDDAMGSPHSSQHSPHSPQHQQNFGGPRQLVGPGQPFGAAPGMAPAMVPAPVPLGRPQPPQSYDDIAAAEMYADDRYADDHMAAPPHLGQMQPGQIQPGQMHPGQMQPGQIAPGQMHPGQMQPGQIHPSNVNDRGYSPAPPSPDSWATAEPPRSASAMDQRAPSPVTRVSPIPEPAALPTFAPMSPLMNELSLNDDDVQPHHLPSPAAAAAAAAATPYDDDATGRMYTEVARAAGVPAPTGSMSPPSPSSQDVYVPPTMPYQHGMPLSPLREVPTPASTTMPLQPDVSEPVVTQAQRVTVPSAAPAPRPLPSIPQAAPNSQPQAPTQDQQQPRVPAARPESVGTDDAYGGI